MWVSHRAFGCVKENRTKRAVRERSRLAASARSTRCRFNELPDKSDQFYSSDERQYSKRFQASILMISKVFQLRFGIIIWKECNLTPHFMTWYIGRSIINSTYWRRSLSIRGHSVKAILACLRCSIRNSIRMRRTWNAGFMTDQGSSNAACTIFPRALARRGVP